MKLADFDYDLPKSLIAQQPIRPRDHSRLLVLRRKGTKLLRKETFRSNLVPLIEHKHFYNIVDYLQAGDVLILNNSKVFPARLIGKKKKTGGRIEVFLLTPTPNPSPARTSRERGIRNTLKCLLGGHGRREGLEIELSRGLECKVMKDNQDGTWQVRFNKSGKVMTGIVNIIGKTPLPPYIKRDTPNPPLNPLPRGDISRGDSRNYQTVYADERKIGSVAAPTAGFHFTKSLINKLKKKGVQFEYITLHVGFGTFAPVKVDNITKHKMHAEFVEVKKDVIQRIIKTKQERRRIIAVGTTSVRTLEAIWQDVILEPPASTHRRRGEKAIESRDPITPFSHSRMTAGYKEWVDVFIYPGYKFKVVDAMITNFHLPKSTLLMLVGAFAGRENIDKAYQSAIKKKYRFYSYGDAMFIY